MRKLEIKHPEYGRFGKLGQYEDRQLAQEKELPNRIDFNPNVLPRVPYGQKRPDEQHKKEVTQKSLEILSKIFVDGIPLTDLYDWEMNVSSFNPHGYGSANWKYYMVGMLKKSSVSKTELKEMVTKAVLSAMNK